MAPVVVMVQPSLPKIREGDDLALKCVAAGAGPGAIVGWTRVGMSYDSNTHSFAEMLR